jgi:AcrR family transcriptional regulator
LLGYRYRSRAVLPDDGPRPPEPDYTQYVPSARPGGRPPHCWLDDHETSTVDLHRDGFALVGPDPIWAKHAAAAAAALDLPVTVACRFERSPGPPPTLAFLNTKIAPGAHASTSRSRFGAGDRQAPVPGSNRLQERSMATAGGRKDPVPTASDRILHAAMSLFVARGYPSTTVEMIAREAGVAVQTVYFSFRAKANILKQLVDINVVGDTQPTPTLERAWIKDALAEPDPACQLEIQVKGTAAIHRRVAPLLNVLRRASDTDPAVAELWRTNQEQRRAVQRQLVTALRRKGGLPPGMRLGQAVDISYAVLGPELFHLLVTERGWSIVEWERWTLSALRHELLV